LHLKNCNLALNERVNPITRQIKSNYISYLSTVSFVSITTYFFLAEMSLFTFLEYITPLK